ncbi:MAG: hypothetical protein HY683_01245 [Chloroflexi bacterium]|nr:hypothetical protein [Chloroflexota bacterium]
MPSELHIYLQDIARRLRLAAASRAEVLRELADHVTDETQELEQQGLARDEAVKQALHRLGGPQELAGALYAVHSQASWGEALLASLPHLAFALLFALHLWGSTPLVTAMLATAAFFSLLAWRRGTPVWAYPWLGYCLVAPAFSGIMALAAVTTGAWDFFNGRQPPLEVAAYVALVLYIPIVLWFVISTWVRAIRRDWLYASLVALPFPLITSWLLLLGQNGGMFAYDGQRLQEADGVSAALFLGLAVVTALVYRFGPRTQKVAALTLGLGLLVVLAVVGYYGNLASSVAVPIVLVGAAILLLPVLLEGRLGGTEGRSAAPQR